MERTGGISNIVTALDGVFSVSGALRFVVLQLVLVMHSYLRTMNEYINEHFKNGSILLFWNVMNLLPDRNPTQTGRSQGTDVAEEVDSFNYNQQDYAIYTEDYGLSKNLAY